MFGFAAALKFQDHQWGSALIMSALTSLSLWLGLGLIHRVVMRENDLDIYRGFRKRVLPYDSMSRVVFIPPKTSPVEDRAAYVLLHLRNGKIIKLEGFEEGIEELYRLLESKVSRRSSATLEFHPLPPHPLHSWRVRITFAIWLLIICVSLVVSILLVTYSVIYLHGGSDLVREAWAANAKGFDYVLWPVLLLGFPLAFVGGTAFWRWLMIRTQLLTREELRMLMGR
jgi:hypothetical protein